jgi:hypothetical protein
LVEQILGIHPLIFLSYYSGYNYLLNPVILLIRVQDKKTSGEAGGFVEEI